VAAGEVVGSILLAGNKLLRVEQLPVGTSSHFVDNGGLQVKENAAGDMLSSARLREEGVESIIATTNGLVGGHLAIGLNAVLQAIKLPAGIADLDTSLADVDGNNFTHGAYVWFRRLRVVEDTRRTLCSLPQMRRNKGQ